ncbi:MAG: hypothetical protein ACFFG0_10440 [Candidatus Thorarchaeota archaeon]
MREETWWIIGIISIIVLFGGLLLYALAYDINCPTYYVMPDGAKCKISEITGGGFGGATHEFYSCNNGKHYINPEYYSKGQKCKK